MNKIERDYYLGDVIKGHTYFIGDFHSKRTPKNKAANLGMPKLRLGIILIVRHPYYKVQFQNSSTFQLNLKNEIKYRTNDGQEHFLTGKDSYCIWIHVSKIKQFISHSEIQELESTLKQVIAKHTKNKIFVEEKILAYEFHNYPLEKKKYWLERKQFMKFEIQGWMSDQLSILKIKLLQKQLQRKRTTNRTKQKICLRILEACDWIQDRNLITNKIQQTYEAVQKRLAEIETESEKE